MPVVIESPTFAVWKTITLDGNPDPRYLIRDIKERGMNIDKAAQSFMSGPNFTLAQEAIDVDLVRLSPKHLHLGNNTSYECICQKALEHGLQLCPAEVGAQLRIDYSDQPNREWIIVAMKPVACLSTGKSYFVVRADPSLWLSMGNIYPGCVWNSTDRFVFMKAQRKARNPFLRKDRYDHN